MAKVKKEIAEILGRFDLEPKDALWDCHGTLVIYHKYCELIAAKAGITFDAPQVIEARSADKIVAICAVGRMGDRTEWSFGEAAPGNNKNAYPYAMAEKRAKDRVILKLVGLAGHIYSEDEADDFKDKPKGAVEVENGHKPAAPSPLPDAVAKFFAGKSYEIKCDDLLTFASKIEKAISLAPTTDALLKLEADNTSDLAALNHESPAIWKQVMKTFAGARANLNQKAA